MVNNPKELSLLMTYCKVAESGSFSKAAQLLNQPKSRVSRAVSRLEDSLNTQLIRRTTRHFSLTETGQRLYENVSPLLDSLNVEIEKITHASDELSGSINISAPEDFGQVVLMGVVSGFSKLYPNVSLNLQLSNEFVNMTSNNIDLAFRIGKLKDSALVQSKISDFKLVLVASKKYLERHSQPKTKAELKEHRLLLFTNENDPVKVLPKSQVHPSSIYCSSFPFLYQMVKEDQGIAVMPDFYCQKDLYSGTIQRVLPNWSVAHKTLQIVYPSKENLPKRVRAFIDYAKENVKASFQESFLI